MKVGIGKPRVFDVEGKKVRAMPTQMVVVNGKTYWYLREMRRPYDDYWYNTKDKIKLKTLQ